MHMESALPRSSVVSVMPCTVECRCVYVCPPPTTLVLPGLELMYVTAGHVNPFHL
uniref:Uncharacterized protein n=1 Tax=Anguilla anguilla TaxID=7936 RepID=A0A0E9WKB9_ANGAN